ncbi:SDR family oxidoreductase [Streptomyces sp. ST2-7A]|uniref:SDR family oxidoreductase n=1 Tax=Streptomyces sp. ST2-7A TaxID=2907214 RepID=UPI001F42D130|nr:NAD(P)H-binding protein [Streptomyces sp. ST2-7A]MCE7079059.1 NAD(P)H-binding protein [Streptomyces sp. ST2-7A]
MTSPRPPARSGTPSTRRIAVAGATGRIGSLTVTALERAGHEVVRIGRSLGVDVVSGAGLDSALTGVEGVIDVTNHPPADRATTVERFGTATRTLLDAGRRAGVRHHVLLSIAGLDRLEGTAHYAGKREQERLVTTGPVPWTIVPTTQFHDFAAMVAEWTERDGVARIAPLLVQPIAPADVADLLVEVVTGPPRGRHPEVAGPEPQDLVDMARRTHAARGRSVRLVPTWGATFGPEMAGDVLLPREGARIAPTSFDEWLASHGGEADGATEGRSADRARRLTGRTGE